MKHKRIISFIFCVLMPSNCYAEGIKININKKNIEFDVPPILENNRTMVPMRAIFEEFGCDVEWLSESKTIIATKGSKLTALQIGKKKIITTDIETSENNVTEIDTAPVILNNRTLVPVRFIAETFGCSVEWDSESQTVAITTK